MGYTHYWYIKDMEALRQALPHVVADFKQLMPQLPPLASWSGKDNPILGSETLEFNGVAPDHYETFWLDVNPKDYLETEQGLFNCCKTQHRPYDLAVQVALVLLKWHSEAITPGAVNIDSDGNLVNWSKACELVENLGYPVDPLWVLGREVWQVKSQTGAIFYIEWPKHKSQDLGGWLEQVQRHELIPLTPPFSLHGPLMGYPPGKPIEEGSSIYTTRGR